MGEHGKKTPNNKMLDFGHPERQAHCEPLVNTAPDPVPSVRGISGIDSYGLLKFFSAWGLSSNAWRGLPQLDRISFVWEAACHSFLAGQLELLDLSASHPCKMLIAAWQGTS